MSNLVTQGIFEVITINCNFTCITYSSKTEVVDEKAVDMYEAEIDYSSSCDESTYDTGYSLANINGIR